MFYVIDKQTDAVLAKFQNLDDAKAHADNQRLHHGGDFLVEKREFVWSTMTLDRLDPVR